MLSRRASNPNIRVYSTINFAPRPPADFVNFCGAGRGSTNFLRGGAGRSSLIHRLQRCIATIANFQWFSKSPSPLNGMVEGNHWDQWFSDGFGIRQPLVTMVFDGCAPLVRRWNGYVPSSKSNIYL